jgi:hypothetical protein
MKRIILFLFLFASLYNCEAQIAKCQFFLLTYEIDGHGKWLDFVNDSVCIYSVGSLSWGTNSDTLNYKIEKGEVVFFSKDSSEVFMKMAIDKVRNRKHRKVGKGLARDKRNYYQTNGDLVGKIFVLKPIE